jgi:hypothetical protein
MKSRFAVQHTSNWFQIQINAASACFHLKRYKENISLLWAEFRYETLRGYLEYLHSDDNIKIDLYDEI